MSEDFATQVKGFLEVARAHVATVTGLCQEMVEDCDRPPTQILSIRTLAWDVSEQLEDLNRLIDDACPKPGEMASQYELGFADALRSVEHAVKGPKGGSTSQSMGVLLGRTLAKLHAHFEDRRAAEASATDPASPGV